MWSLIILFATLSVIFFSGRGSILVAGYNTLSKEEKKSMMKKNYV